MTNALLVTVCLTGAFAQDSHKTTNLITAHNKSTPTAPNPKCQLFTAAEAAKYIGEPVAKARNATGGCEWPAKDDSGDVMVTVVPAEYHTMPRGAKSFRPLADVGEQGFVCKEFDGWAAGAVLGKNTVKVSVAGNGASEEQAVALLKEALKRVK